ncbi:YggT family protein [Rickettsiales bacterium]|nr:YggT family protein [Rickettsiales bacterium]
MNINPFIELISSILGIYSWILIIWIIMSWLISFRVINTHNMVVSKVSEVLYRLTEPVLRPIREYIPDLGGIDLSPIVVFLLIRFVDSAMYTYLYKYGIQY